MITTEDWFLKQTYPGWVTFILALDGSYLYQQVGHFYVDIHIWYHLHAHNSSACVLRSKTSVDWSLFHVFCKMERGEKEYGQNLRFLTRRGMSSTQDVFCKMEVSTWGCGQNLRFLTRQGDVHVLKRRKNESNKAL